MRFAIKLLLVAGCSPQNAGEDPRGVGACAHGHEMPSDRAVSACLAAQQVEFATLVSMTERDSRTSGSKPLVVGTDRIGECWRLADGWGCGGLESALHRVDMTAERYHRYVGLLTTVGGYRIHQHAGAVTISLSRQGIVTSGASKDLVYKPGQAPSPVVLDTDRDRSQRYTVNYAALGGGWFIEHSSN